MQWFNNLKIAQKLIAGFMVVLVLMTFLGIFCQTKLSSVNSSAAEIKNNWMPSIIAVAKLNHSVNYFRRCELQHILSTTPQDMDKYEKMMSDIREEFTKNKDEYKKLLSSDKEKLIFDEFLKYSDEFLAINLKVIEASRQNRNEEAKAMQRGESKKNFDLSIAKLKEATEINNQGGISEAERGNEIYNSAVT